MGRKEKDRRIVGRIIFANFLKLPPDKFDRYIKSVERLPIFTKLLGVGIISVENISRTSPVEGFTVSEGIIAQIVKYNKNNKSKQSVYINYLSDGFTKRYLVTDAVQRDCEVNLLLNKLRHITTKNEFTHQILTSIIKYQKDYFTMGFDANLKILTQKSLSDYITALTGLKIDESWISRMVKGKSIISPRGKVLPLKFLFHKRKNIKKGLVKRILDDERSSLKSGNLTRAYSDRKIAEKIKNNYRVEISSRLISSYRRELGVPPFFVRIHGGIYPPLDVKFSPSCLFNRCSVNKNAADVPGVYELSIIDKKISYKNDKTGIFYIGCAGNLKKRLKEHLSINGKNGGVLKIVKNNRCSFKYIAFYENWRKEEKRLYKLFVSTFGEPPKCNKLSP